MNEVQKINIDLKRIFESLPLSKKNAESYIKPENMNFGTSDFKLETDKKLSECDISAEELDWLTSLNIQTFSSNAFFRTFKYWIFEIYNHPAKYFKIWINKFLIIYLEVFLFLFPLVGILIFHISKRSLLETLLALALIESILYFVYRGLKKDYEYLNIQKGAIIDNSTKYLNRVVKIYHLKLFDDKKSYRFAKRILEVEKNEIESSEKKILENSVINGFIYSAAVVFFLRLYDYIEYLAGFLGGLTRITNQDSLRTTVISLVFASIFFVYKYRSIILQEEKLNKIKYCLSLVDEVIKLKDDQTTIDRLQSTETELQELKLSQLRQELLIGTEQLHNGKSFNYTENTIHQLFDEIKHQGREELGHDL